LFWGPPPPTLSIPRRGNGEGGPTQTLAFGHGVQNGTLKTKTKKERV